MKCDEKMLRLYAVTDRSWLGEQTLAQAVEQALRGGVTCVQLREKTLDRAAFLAEAKTIGALCARYGVPLIINDDVELAKACGAAGVHIGQQDCAAGTARQALGDGMLIGVSARTVEQAKLAEANGADYLGVGACFGTTTKLDAKPIPLDTVREICAAVNIPVVAIGGVSAENLPQLAGTGVRGAAVVSALFAAQDIEGAARRLRALSDDMVKA